MDFRNGVYCTVWSVEPKSDTFTKCRLSASHKDKNTGEFVEDFSIFAGFLGTATAKKAAQLKVKDRIKLTEVGVRPNYVKEKNTTYYNFNVYSFETENASSGAGAPRQTNNESDIIENSDLPF